MTSCALYLQQVAPTKGSTSLQLSMDISDINDLEDDVNTTADATESTAYDSSNSTDLDNSLQPTYLIAMQMVFI